MESDISRLLELLTNNFGYSELQLLAFDLNIDFDALLGETKDAKARELVAFLQRRNRLSELEDLLRSEWPQLYAESPPATDSQGQNSSDVSSLNIELANLRQQLVELQSDSLTHSQLEQKVKEILKTTNRAVGRSEEIRAHVILPRQEDLDVRLVPSHSLQRLEEYRSDENRASLLIGAFIGAILGILSNWATNESFLITRFSLVLMSFLAVLTVACMFWVRAINKRADVIEKQIFYPVTKKSLRSKDSKYISGRGRPNNSFNPTPR